MDLVIFGIVAFVLVIVSYIYGIFVGGMSISKKFYSGDIIFAKDEDGTHLMLELNDTKDVDELSKQKYVLLETKVIDGSDTPEKQFL